MTNQLKEHREKKLNDFKQAFIESYKPFFKKEVLEKGNPWFEDWIKYALNSQLLTIKEWANKRLTCEICNGRGVNKIEQILDGEIIRAHVLCKCRTKPNTDLYDLINLIDESLK